MTTLKKKEININLVSKTSYSEVLSYFKMRPDLAYCARCGQEFINCECELE